MKSQSISLIRQWQLWPQMSFGNIDGEVLQQAIREPVRFGQEFTRFLQNGGRVVVGEPKVLQINSSKLFTPAEFIGEGWTVWRGPIDGDGLSGEEDQDARSLSLKEIDFSKAIFETCLKKDESSIRGEEKLKRLRASSNIRGGGNIFLSLWQDYQQNKDRSVLEWLRKNRNVTYLDFMGLVLRDPRGDRCVLCLCWYGNEWCWDDSWLGLDWHARSFSVCLAS